MLAGNTGAMWCVVAVFCGHVWPVFFGFRGGKGVATAFGALLGLSLIHIFKGAVEAAALIKDDIYIVGRREEIAVSYTHLGSGMLSRRW